jgi:paraquat-inducible protein B
MRYDPQTNDLRPLAEIMVYQHLFDEHIDAKTRSLQKISSRASRNEILQKLVVERGLRAQLRTGSLISGQLYVGLDYFRDAQKARVDWKQDPPEFPVVPGGMTGIQEKVQAILAKLEKMPLDEIGEDVRKTLASLDNAVRGAGRTMERVEGKTLPELERALLDLRGTIDEAGRLMSNADNTLAGPDAPVRQELREALKEIARSARAIRLLADYLERNPGDLIRGKTQQEMP